MANKIWAGRREAHAPVNPVTGEPRRADSAAAHEQVPAEAPAPGEASTQRVTADGAAPFWDDDTPARLSVPSSAATQAAGAAPVSGAASESFVDRVDEELAPKTLLEHLSALMGNRAFSICMLFVVLLVVVGPDQLLLFVVLLFLGYLLIDRFPPVRRCVIMGGAAWLATLLVGFIVSESVTAPIVFGLDHVFMIGGFLLAVAVCGAYFAGRSMYRYGYDRGQEEADHVISAHIVDRLIEHRDNWDELDGSFLEVESAVNRVRESERKAEQALRDDAARKDDLVTYLAHDLKTPLASVVGYLSLLEEAPDLPLEQRAHFCGIALEKARRLDALIEEFFDITRFDFHDMVLTRGYVDLSLLLAQVVDEFYPTLSAQNKDAEVDVPEGLSVLVDADKMARVFNNVMKNAIAYSYEGSTIRVSARRLGTSLAAASASQPSGDAATAAHAEGPVEIRFENQGDPIPAPKLKVIFEKFYRLDAARATNHGGAGLGLAIAKEIVAAHGGTISCESSPEHTVFIIVLPA